MGIGPMNSSLLDKLGIKGIKDLSTEELRALVDSDRQHRAFTRAAGRIKRIIKDDAAPKTHRTPPTLESIGLAPALIVKLRASGRTDAEVIAFLKEKGAL